MRQMPSRNLAAICPQLQTPTTSITLDILRYNLSEPILAYLK